MKTVERAIPNFRISNRDIHTIAEWLFKGSLAGLTPAPGFCDARQTPQDPLDALVSTVT